MAKGSASKAEEPKSLDKAKEDENAKDPSSFPDEEEFEEDYLEVDPNDFEEIDPEDLERKDLDELYEVFDEEYEEDMEEVQGEEAESASEKQELEDEGESRKEEKKKWWGSIFNSSSDEEEEKPEDSGDTEDSDDSESDYSDEGDEGYEGDKGGKGDKGDKGGKGDKGSGKGQEKTFSDNSRKENIRRLMDITEPKGPRDERRVPTLEEIEEVLFNQTHPFDFPVDPEGWRETDLQEFWCDGPLELADPGWDPVWAEKEDWEVMRKMEREGEAAPIAPFYVPYTRPYPVIPNNHHDIHSPKSVIEELDRIEEFLKWVSYVFPDGSS